MIAFAPGVEAKVTAAIGHLVNKGRQEAMYRLMGAGLAIAKTTQAIGTLRHGPLLALPVVTREGDEAVRVGFKGARPRTVAVLAKHLALAKRREWPSALQK